MFLAKCPIFFQLKRLNFISTMIIIFIASGCDSDINVKMADKSLRLEEKNQMRPLDFSLTNPSVYLNDGETYYPKIMIKNELKEDRIIKMNTIESSAKVELGHFDAFEQTITIPKGTPAGEFSLPAVKTKDNGAGCEGIRKFQVSISELNVSEQNSQIGEIFLPPKDGPKLSFSSVTVTEGEQALIRASLDKPCLNKDISFDAFTASHNSIPNLDFTVVSSRFSIPKGERFIDLPINTLDDSIGETSEEITVGISNVLNATYEEDKYPKVTIGDDDTSLGALKVAVNSHSSCAVSVAGDLKCWGSGLRGIHGQNGINLGDDPGEMGDNLPFMNLGTGMTVKKSVRSLRHHCAILDDALDTHDDKLKCWGNNEYGQLGYGSTENMGDSIDEVGDSLPFVDLGVDDTVIDVAVASRATCVIVTGGDVKCFGIAHRLANQDDDNRNHIGDEPGEMGTSLATVDLGTNLKAKKIYGNGGQFCVIVDDTTDTYDDHVKCWGSNGSGALGLGDTNNRGMPVDSMGDNLAFVDLGTSRTAKEIAIGGTSTICAILDNDKVKCWGYNGSSSYNRLGYGDSITENIGDEPAEMGDNLPILDFGPNYIVKKITIGYSAGCAIVTTDNVDDVVKCWGWSGYGQLANSRNSNEGASWTYVDFGDEDRAIDISSGKSGHCAILINNEVKCWGKDDFGRNGKENTADLNGVDDVAPIDLGSSLTAVALVTGNNGDSGGIIEPVECAVFSDGRMKCWGQNLYGRLLNPMNLGDEASEMGSNLAPVNLGAGKKAVDVTLGNEWGCALLDDKTTKCWGFNLAATGTGLNVQANPGFGDTASMADLNPIDLGTNVKALDIQAFPGVNATCVLTDTNEIKCFGQNWSGVLGTENGSSIGDNSNEMGDNLVSVNLGEGRKALKMLSLGGRVCALLDNQSLKCWGRNISLFGSYGINSTLGNGPGEMGDNLIEINVDPSEKIVDIAGGNAFICALMENEQVKCWGGGSDGKLGQKSGSTANIGEDPSEMGSALGYLDFGINRTVKTIWAGEDARSMCALLDNNVTKCWGKNQNGQLGLGDTNNRGDDADEVSVTLEALDLGSSRIPVDISISDTHSCAVLDDGGVKCWGNNIKGALGIGNTTSMGDDPGEMGDALPYVSLDF